MTGDGPPISGPCESDGEPRPVGALMAPTPRDRWCDRLLGRPATILLGMLCLAQLLTWIPHYLTWPLWADHDVFATIARGWDAGLLPYRDLPCNQFPGAIYLFWILGQTAGWGAGAALYAVDAGAVVLLGLGLVVWSRRLFGRALPGIVGYLSFLNYYLTLDYSQTAQRDWHAPMLAVLGLLILQAARGGTLAAAVAGGAMSLAISLRPQAVLFLPAVAFQFLAEARAGGDVRRPAAWLLTSVLATAGWLLPLAASGILPDFLAGIGRHNTPVDGRGLHPAALLANVLRQLDNLGLIAVAVAVAMLPKSDRRLGSSALIWLAALASALLYEPISPRHHDYLRIPLQLLFSVNVAVLTHLLLDVRRVPASFKLLTLLLVLGISARIRPDLCTLRPSLRAVAAGVGGGQADGPPPGYLRGPVAVSAFYEWADYRATLDYLRPVASARTKIANVLKGDPAIVGPLGGFSAFPAESLAWLRMVARDDEARFAASLEREPDSVVVWSPGEAGPDPAFKIDRIETVILRHYEPEARFGVIEVWRRKGSPGPGTSVATRPPARPRVGG